MRILTITLLLLSLFPAQAAKQSPAAPLTDADRLNKSCADVLALSSSDWLDLYSQKDSSTLGIVSALRVYGDCFDRRTGALVGELGRAGTGPLMGAMGDFREFNDLLDDFVRRALAATSSGGTMDQIRAAYATLYKKQFRYRFFLSYTNPPASSPENPAALDAARNHLVQLFLSHKGHEGADLGLAFTELRNAYADVFTDPLPLHLFAISLLQSPADPPYSPPPF